MKGKKVSGEDYVEVDEMYKRKKKKKQMKSMKTAGMARALKKSEKKMGYSDEPRLKSQKKLTKKLIAYK